MHLHSHRLSALHYVKVKSDHTATDYFGPLIKICT
jgi:hypothetical protein